MANVMSDPTSIASPTSSPVEMDAPATRELRPARPEWWTAILLTALVVWLHFVFWQHAGALWRDEVNVFNLASSPSLSDMTRDSFPILMPALVKIWHGLGLGATDTGLRAFGALVGLGLLAALWLASLVTRRAPPLLGLALVALNSTMLTYGDSLRAYGLGCVTIILCFAGMWAFLQKPNLKRGVLGAIASILAVQALYQNSALVAGLCAGAWAVCWRRRAGRQALVVLGIGVIAAITLAPYVPSLIAVPEAASGLRIGIQWQRAWGNLQTAIGFPLEDYTYAWFGLIVIAVAGAVVSWFRRTPARAAGSADDIAEVRLFAGVSLIVALGGFVGFHWVARMASQPWYYLPMMALAVVCFDAALPPLTRLARVVSIGFVLGTALAAFPYAQKAAEKHFTNIDQLARTIEQAAAPGDLVVVTPWYCGISFQRYFKGPAAWETIPPLNDHRLHRYDLVKTSLGVTDPVKPILDQAAATLQAGHSVWVVGTLRPPPRGKVPPEILGPAPHPVTGWSDAPYLRNWDERLTWCLGARGGGVKRLELSRDFEVSQDEELDLYVANPGQSPATAPRFTIARPIQNSP